MDDLINKAEELLAKKSNEPAADQLLIMLNLIQERQELNQQYINSMGADLFRCIITLSAIQDLLLTKEVFTKEELIKIMERYQTDLQEKREETRKKTNLKIGL